MRRRARVDANQAEIVAALRKMGATVTPLHAVGGGVPDLLAGLHGVTHLIEIKDGAKPPSAQKLTPDQEEYHASWRGAPIIILRTVEQAMEWVKSHERKAETNG